MGEFNFDSDFRKKRDYELTRNNSKKIGKAVKTASLLTTAIVTVVTAVCSVVCKKQNKKINKYNKLSGVDPKPGKSYYNGNRNIVIRTKK